MISRRGLLTATLSAVPMGVAGGFKAHSWQQSGSTIRILGRNKAMIALLDTGTTRALFMLGEPDITVLANLAQLLPFGRTRVDLLVGSHRWLTTEGVRSNLDLHRITTISLQSSASVPPIRGNVVPVTDAQLLGLGDGCTLTVALSGASSDAPTDPVIHIDILCSSARIVLASSASALGEEDALALLVVPGKMESKTLMHISPGLFIGTELPGEYNGATMLAHHNDPIRLNIKNASVTT